MKTDTSIFHLLSLLLLSTYYNCLEHQMKLLISNLYNALQAQIWYVVGQQIASSCSFKGSKGFVLLDRKAKEKYASLPAAKKQSLMLRGGIATIGRRPIEQLLTPVQDPQVYCTFNSIAHMSDYGEAHLNAFYHRCGILVEPNRYK